MAIVRLEGAERLQISMQEAHRLVHKAVADAAAPPPKGMVKASLNLVVSQKLLADEVALGAFLVRQFKRSMVHGL